MSNLSDLLPSGGGSKSADFVASGTLPNGKPVVLKADGTVEVVGMGSVSLPESIPAGSEYVFSAASTSPNDLNFDPNTAGKFVVAYNSGGNGYAAVGTVVGTTISFGTAVSFNAITTNPLSMAFDPNTANKFVVAYSDGTGGGRATAIVGTVSGTTISFGTGYQLSANLAGYISVSFDPNTANKFVVVYSDAGNAHYGTAIIGTISGTSISYGSKYVFNSAGTTNYDTVAFDPNTANKFVVVYANGNSSYSTAKVGTVSGTTISYGAAAVFNAAWCGDQTLAFDPNTSGKFVAACYDGDNSNAGTANVGTYSGTTITFGAEYVFNAGSTSRPRLSFDPNTANQFVVVYNDVGNANYGTARVGTVSGTAISYGAELITNSGASTYNTIAFDPNTAGKFVVGYQDGGNSNYGTSVVGQLAATVTATNLTSTNFVGMPDAAYSSGATATVVLQGGISLNQTSLTIGTTYFVQGDGTLGTSAGTPSVEAGRAISATSLLIKGI